MKRVEIWTDGSCKPNPGKAAGGAVLFYKGHTRAVSAYFGDGTNNTAEIDAITMALEALTEPCEVTVYTDSQYVQKVYSGQWDEGANPEQWRRLHFAANGHHVTIAWIRKNSHKYNNRAHQEANLVLDGVS